jgi:ABC-type molybdate transport system substrate-binding protein
MMPRPDTMSSEDYQYGRQSNGWLIAGVVSVLAVVGLFALLKKQTALPETTKESLVVYCAAGIRKPVEETAKQYEAEFDVTIRLDYGSSGEMEGKLALDLESGTTRADLYIPADKSFADRAKGKGLTRESIPLAKFRLVLAVKPDSTHDFKSIDGLLESGVDFVVCDELAGVGKKTKKVLTGIGKWEAIHERKKVSYARVPEAASAVKTSDSVAAGFLWDSTAKQFGLKILEMPELNPGRATITANVTEGTTKATQALHFARYLAALEKGQPSFKKHHFTPINGDSWADVPEIVAYCGGVNRNALKDTFAEFEKREGCVVKTTYAGCGTIVGNIEAGEFAMPDAFMTCDVTYMDMIQKDFLAPQDVSSTRVVMLVRKGNPKGINSLKDLTKDGVSVGTTGPRHSTLGALSWQMFEQVGVKAELEQKKSVIVTSPTAHELILKMEGHTKLDVALVYEANCQHLTDNFELVHIDLPRARAVQNVAVGKVTKFPNLTARLMDTILSTQSKERFEGNGFSWEAKDDSKTENAKSESSGG